MNNQNILNKNSNEIKLRLDNSESYDIFLSNSENNYYSEILEFYNENISYNTPIIDESLNNLQTFLFSIKLNEIDVNDENYIYSGLTFTINYNSFVNYIGTNYSKIILNTDIYTYTGLTNEIHYFKINNYNQPYFIPSNINLSENLVISKFSKNVIECENILYGEECCDTIPKLNNKPRLYKIESCDNLIKNRYSKGWTLDFIFNRNNLDWSFGGIFYHLGVRGETTNINKADNDLSFGFDSNGAIVWYSTHYSGYTNEEIGFSGIPYINSGKTNDLCVSNSNKDFKITIVFDRYNYYDDIKNNGGSNDLITGCTLDNTIYEIISGDTSIFTYDYVFNEKWVKNKNKRLGILKIYLNGQPIFKFDNWEETIPFNKGLQPLIQSWGGGSYFIDNILYKICYFNIKNIKYYDKPLLTTEIKHNFNYESFFYNFDSCKELCSDNLTKLT